METINDWGPGSAKVAAFPIVAIGGSVGRLEALRQLLAHHRLLRQPLATRSARSRDTGATRPLRRNPASTVLSARPRSYP